MDSDKCDEHWSRLTIRNNIAYLPVLAAYVRSVAEQAGFPAKEQRRIELAIEEVASTVIEQAFDPNETASFDVICQEIPGGLQVSLRDKGIPYDPALEPDYTPGSDIESQSVAGLGGFLARQLMDEYVFCNMGRDGKETRMVKYLDQQGPINPDQAAPEPEVTMPPETPVRKRIDFDIRLMRPEEAIEVARCVYDSYGYSYANEHIYFPERIVKMNESGSLRSAVAVTTQNEVAGHFALICYDHLPAEIGIAVTKKKFRGQGFARKLGEFLDAEARGMGLKGVHVKEVTVHPYTQKFCEKLGYKDCGFLLAHSPKTLSFKGIADELAQRNSDILGFRYLQPPEQRTVYAPGRHVDVIRGLYENLGVPVTLAQVPKCAPGDEPTLMVASINSLRSLGEVQVTRFGSDFIPSLRSELHRMRREEVRVIEMYLSLADPLMQSFVPDIESLGFFFTGIMPETPVGDALVMQYLNGVQVEYDGITVVSDTARDLLEYIQKLDPHGA
ncbi:MAG: GNAT family N-acetyltransferase [Phycisphaeraceae bacterium]|nr:GNAT family N-acetyltransferase [Phycisphaeraceae bacterium]